MPIVINPIANNSNILDSNSSFLVPSRNIIRSFGNPEDYMEMHISDPLGKILFSVTPFKNYKVEGNYLPTENIDIEDIIFSPEVDATNIALSNGSYVIKYNIFRPKVYLSNNRGFFIKEISADRTEIRLVNNNISPENLVAQANTFILENQAQPYFKEFYLNFGSNKLIPAVNIALDINSNPFSVLIKLLNPLPTEYSINNTLNIVDALSNPISFTVDISPDPVATVFPTLRGPNFDLDIDNLKVSPTSYYNFNQITNFKGNFNPQLQQLLGYLSASNFAINIDYTNYEDYVHFSSAARRLEGFQYKLQQIEFYTSASEAAENNINVTSHTDIQDYKTKISSVIQSFDGYEQFLYFESSSYTFPKQNSTKPYINFSVTSSEAVNWYTSNYSTASLYDDNNQNYLLYTLPGYLTENEDNELLFKFVASLGQMFDDIWIHIKAITDLYQAKNSLTEGISKDLVYFALQSMGINVYTDQSNENVFKYLYGVDENGNYLPQTGSYDTLVSASNYQIPGQDIQKGIYKRLYHNLPLLLKSKGTTRFIQYLNTIFGVPSTIMSYIEYGGTDKLSSSFEYEYDRFSYALNKQIIGSTGISATTNPAITVPWVFLSQSVNNSFPSVGSLNDITPNAIEFRFKAYPTSSYELSTTFATQSLFSLLPPSGKVHLDFRLQYTSTGSADSIYSGSVGDFGYFVLKVNGNNWVDNPGDLYVTSSTIPIFTTGSDGDTSWYSVLIQKRDPNQGQINLFQPQYYDFYIKNNIHGQIGHVASASLFIDGNVNPSEQNIWYNPFPSKILQLGGGSFPNESNISYYPFTGSLQELRLWAYSISESIFDIHVLNPDSIEGNSPSSAYNTLAARFPLGNNLYTYNHGNIATVASTAPDQVIQSFTASFISFPKGDNYAPNKEIYYANTANSGYYNPVTDKIRIYSGSEYGTQLLPNKSIEIRPTIPITKDLHLLDASLSPQNEVDKNIIAHLGSSYNMDDIIGDPTGTSYNSLAILRDEYFKKYINKYNYKDYIRLIDFFHNSLFKTLKDFTPARTNLFSGLTIKNHLLERSYKTIEDPLFKKDNNLSQSINIASITASNGGDYKQQVYTKTIKSTLGPVTFTTDGRDFYTGDILSSSLSYHDFFDILNFNPYALEYNFNKSKPFSSSLWNVEYNPLLNNVERNQISARRKKITNINNKLLFVSDSKYALENFEYQDYTDTYIRYLISKYKGSKTTSAKYTFYTPGDFTFGKTAAIDKNTWKFAIMQEAICTGSDIIAFPERTNLYIKYLSDEKGNLDELIRRKYESVTDDKKILLYTVQRMFKSGDVLNVGLFNYRVPSKQARLDGNHTIFQGGFKYEPVVWHRNDNSSTNHVNVYTVDSEKYTSFINNVFISNVSTVISQTYTTQGSSGGGDNYIDNDPGRGQQAVLNYPTTTITVTKANSSITQPFDVTVRVFFSDGTYKDELFEFGAGVNNVTKTFNYVDKAGTSSGLISITNTIIDSIDWKNNTPDIVAIPRLEDVQPIVIQDSVNPLKFSFGIFNGSVSNVPTISSVPGSSVPGSGGSIIYQSLLEIWYGNIYFWEEIGPLPSCAQTDIDNNTCIPLDFEFRLAPGDIIRFYPVDNVDSVITFNIPIYEYTIVSIETPTAIPNLKSSATFTPLTFTIDRPIAPELLLTNNLFKYTPFWIISRKLNDETNIVIQFRKNNGKTAGAIIKNVDLDIKVDGKIGNIIADLETTILSN
jgi:hypothetical protein